ncbi:rhomboid family intramembrane serine protease [Rhizobium sp. YIM 134829]|uniref:rhomboid family intramembrane serine protease n=1 Tax=Rhizobium sp. YIM 134829 TaxID=3390453 RepID=UPI00397D1EBF
MFIPLHDANTLKHIRLQYVTIAIILVNITVFVLTGPPVVSEMQANMDLLRFGYVPALIFGDATLAPDLAVIPEPATFLTYAFLHGDIWHVGTNMLFLWVFGDNVEDALGHVRFLLFYLLSAAAGALFHGLLNPESQAPLIGASGAVSGVVAAYLVLHPRVRVWVLVFFRIPLPLPAFVPLLFWIGQQFYMLVVDPTADVSWGAHVGGIVTGLGLVFLLRRREVPLLDRRLVTPLSVIDTGRPAPGPWGPRALSSRSFSSKDDRS